MAHLSEREAVFARNDLFAAVLAHAPGRVTKAEAEREVAALEKAGTLHAVNIPGAEDSLATAKTVGEERETVASMRAGQGRGRAPMRSWMVQGHLNKEPLTAGQKDAVKLILSAEDRVVGVQGYAGSGKTTMLDRARVLAEKKGYRMIGLAPSASAVQTLASEAGIESETLQRFLARNAGVAEGRLTRKGAKEMRAAFAKTILVVDEGSLASTVQARDLLRIANEIRIPRVVLVGDAKQLDAVDAGKPFAQLQAAGMQTAVMDEIMRQRDPDLKQAVEASLKGEIGKAFEKLGSNVAEVKPDNIAGAVAARWLALSPEARENTGVMAPSHALRQEINGHIRERLAREGRIHGPTMASERLVSKGYTNAEKALAGNYAKGDVVAFHRPYKRIGVEKGDERRVMGVNHKAREVVLEGKDGGTVAWKPGEIGGRRGGSEVYRREDIELCNGDRIRWTRNDAGLGLVNSRTRHLDHAWASTVHAFQGRTIDNVIAAMEARHPHLTTQKSFYVEISRARDRAELVTDDAAELRAQLQAVTGERIAALEGIGEMKREALGKEAETIRPVERQPHRGAGAGRDRARARTGRSPRRRRRTGKCRRRSAAGARTGISDCSARATGHGRIEDAAISRRRNTGGMKWTASNRSWRRRKPARPTSARRARSAFATRNGNASRPSRKSGAWPQRSSSDLPRSTRSKLARRLTKMATAWPVTTAQLTQRSLASFAEHSGASHLLECGSGLHEVCHSCPEFCGTGHWLSFGWDEADISTEIDGEGSEVGDIVGRGPAADHAVVVQAQIEHEDFVSGHDLVGGAVGGFPGGAIQIEHAPRGDGVEREALAQVLGIVEAAILDAGSGLEDAEELFDRPARFVPLADSVGPFGRGLAFGAKQQPAEWLASAGGRVALGNEHGGHGQRARCAARLAAELAGESPVGVILSLTP